MPATLELRFDLQTLWNLDLQVGTSNAAQAQKLPDTSSVLVSLCGGPGEPVQQVELYAVGPELAEQPVQLGLAGTVTWSRGPEVQGFGGAGRSKQRLRGGH